VNEAELFGDDTAPNDTAPEPETVSAKEARLARARASSAERVQNEDDPLELLATEVLVLVPTPDTAGARASR
jgi:hypothetical protein